VINAKINKTVAKIAEAIEKNNGFIRMTFMKGIHTT
jgi:hypothetical protein